MAALDDIKKYAPKADENVVAAMEKTYALVLSNPDARQVSFSDDAELKTVRENFVKKKLGIVADDAAIDATIKEIGAKIPGHKNRLTVYYLLADHYGKLGVFGG